MPKSTKSKPTPQSTKSKPMPKFTRTPEELVQIFEKTISDFPMAEQRKVFGYPAAFVNGQMFTGPHGTNVILRLAEPDRAAFMAQYKTQLFEPMPGRPMKEYVLVPEVVYKSPQVLGPWIEKAMAFAQSLPPKTARKR